jgi:hypothetical protein
MKEGRRENVGVVLFPPALNPPTTAEASEIMMKETAEKKKKI